jgi:hypothetical protein
MWITGVQSSLWVAGTSACTGKETFCTAQQQAGSLYSNSLARPSVTKQLHWVEGVATAIALVTVPPEGGIYYGQVYLEWYSEDTGYGSHWLSPPTSKGEQQMMGTSMSLVLTSSSQQWVRSHSRHRHFANRSYGWTTTASTFMCPY